MYLHTCGCICVCGVVCGMCVCVCVCVDICLYKGKISICMCVCIYIFIQHRNFLSVTLYLGNLVLVWFLLNPQRKEYAKKIYFEILCLVLGLQYENSARYTHRLCFYYMQWEQSKPCYE